MIQKIFKNLIVIIGMLLILIPVEAFGESPLDAMPNGVDSTGISDMQKATSFVKRLGPNAKVLLKLPAKAPHCVYYKENRFVKCYNVETDSVTNIVFPDIERTLITYILPGVSNITVIAKDKYGDPIIEKYDIEEKKFYKINLGQEEYHSQFDGMYGVLEVDKPIVSYPNKTFTFSFNEARDGDTGILDITSVLGDYPSTEEWNAYMKKTIWHKVTKVFNFDGDLKSEVAKPVTWSSYMQSLRNKKKKR